MATVCLTVYQIHHVLPTACSQVHPAACRCLSYQRASNSWKTSGCGHCSKLQLPHRGSGCIHIDMPIFGRHQHCQQLQGWCVEIMVWSFAAFNAVTAFLPPAAFEVLWAVLIQLCLLRVSLLPSACFGRCITSHMRLLHVL